MLRQFEYDCLINQELDDLKKQEFFYVKQKKFLHNIDTFYYTVTFTNDFSKDTEDAHVLELRRFFGNLQAVSAQFDACVPVYIEGLVERNILYRGYSFGKYYKCCLESPEEFDVFIAPVVPTDKTSQMVVQLRSNYLWLKGVRRAFEDSFEVVQKIVAYFKLQILEVKENRCDYCWHTNYIQAPEKFFRPDRFAQMQVSRFKGGLFRYRFKRDSSIENDYIALGNRGGNCFVRIYLKSKEVIEMGYKPYFLKVWQLYEMISRYDFYVYDKCFQSGNWLDVDRYRLEFYQEHGQNKYYKKQIKDLLSVEPVNYRELERLADVLTPPVTLVLNVEFQVTRKSTKSYTLIKFRQKNKGITGRVQDFIDNWPLVSDYLTHSTLRLVDTDATCDDNKSRAPYVEFWKRLRNTRPMELLPVNKGKLVRDYDRELSAEIVKRRMCNSLITYSIYCKGQNDDDVYEDALSSIIRLNDNDMERMRDYKRKRMLQFKPEDFEDLVDNLNVSSLRIINTETGEFYD